MACASLRRIVAGSLIVALFAVLTVASVQAVGPDENEWAAVVDKGIKYLRGARAEDGSYSKEKSLGITGVVVTGLLQTGQVPPGDPSVAKSLEFLESLVNLQQGHIAGKDPRHQLKNYVTSVNVMAFSEADKALVRAGQPRKYKKIVDMGAHYLKELQWDDGEGVGRTDVRRGGVGYDSKGRPDLSNTQFTLEAVKDILPKDDPFFKEATLFVSRCQNLKGEYNDQPWAAFINDGSFIYAPGETKADPLADGGLTGYGSMTYAGIKSMIYAGVEKKDPRIVAAWEWIRKNYTVEENPGMPKGRGQQALYYYYHTMAKCFDVLGVDYVEDAKGVKHDWRKEITAALAKRQRPDGSWLNDADRWMEGDPNLVTAYALMTLSYCKPKK